MNTFSLTILDRMRRSMGTPALRVFLQNYSNPDWKVFSPVSSLYKERDSEGG